MKRRFHRSRRRGRKTGTLQWVRPAFMYVNTAGEGNYPRPYMPGGTDSGDVDLPVDQGFGGGGDNNRTTKIHSNLIGKWSFAQNEGASSTNQAFRWVEPPYTIIRIIGTLFFGIDTGVITSTFRNYWRGASYIVKQAMQAPRINYVYGDLIEHGARILQQMPWYLDQNYEWVTKTGSQQQVVNVSNATVPCPPIPVDSKVKCHVKEGETVVIASQMTENNGASGVNTSDTLYVIPENFRFLIEKH